jgi:anti-sigma regulatory factor (Ser/Thr protein kinase)
VLPCDAASVAAARQLVRGQLTAHAHAVPELVEAASLLVSELVTNAIVHARTAIELRLLADDRMFRAEVTDRNPTLPTRRRPTALTGTGRGLQLIDNLASRRGVSLSDAGKTVWFEMTFAIGRAV